MAIQYIVGSIYNIVQYNTIVHMAYRQQVGMRLVRLWTHKMISDVFFSTLETVSQSLYTLISMCGIQFYSKPHANSSK